MLSKSVVWLLLLVCGQVAAEGTDEYLARLRQACSNLAPILAAASKAKSDGLTKEQVVPIVATMMLTKGLELKGSSKDQLNRQPAEDRARVEAFYRNQAQIILADWWKKPESSQIFSAKEYEERCFAQMNYVERLCNGKATAVEARECFEDHGQR